MKNITKQLAFLLCFLSGIQVITAGLIRQGFLAKSLSNQEWIEPFFRYILLPDPTITLLVLVVSFCVWVLLRFLGRTRQKTPSSPPSPPRPESVPQTRSLPKPKLSSPRYSQKSLTLPPKNRVKVEEEWRRLEEADKEAIRAIVSQGGLWETDIVALLENRGFLHPQATLEDLAERVSFVDCDYAGYHSIHPEYHAQLVSVLDTDNAEDSL